MPDGRRHARRRARVASTQARSTDGSARVKTANCASRIATTPSRRPGRRPASNGANSSSTNATLDPRHRKQVRQRRRPKVMHHLGQLTPIIAVDESGEQRCIPLRQRFARSLHERAQRVRQPVRRAATVDSLSRANLRSAGEMPGPSKPTILGFCRLHGGAQAPPFPHRCIL